MKLFFSYGHDQNEEIVFRLKDDLEKNGHIVWIDKTQIKGGDDWRRSITSGILDSEFMMSFASNHSIRKPGVCLDELMIAVSVKGAQIQTVLLESNVIPPANIGYRQYIDMSSWKYMWGTNKFESWYAKKLAEILNIIDSPETKKFAEEIEFLKEQLHPNLTSFKKERLQQEYYCGREWMSKLVRDWFEEKDSSRILLIDGPPGIGKSSFMAHEFIFNPSIGSLLFCEWDNPGFNNLDAISRCIVFQLASKISDYRSQVIQYLRNNQQSGYLSRNQENNEEVFRYVLLHQLRNLIDGERPTIIILIDGIDELDEKSDGGRRRNIFAELLQKEIDNFPRWIKFVVTSRCDSRVTIPLQHMAVIHMGESEEYNLQDIRQYLEHELVGKISLKEISQITKKSAGNFLYTKMVTDAIKTDSLSVKDIMEGETGNLGFIYKHYFDRTFQNLNEYEEIFYPMISALAVTEERIPDNTVRNITGCSRRKHLQNIKVISPFLSPERDYLKLFHKSLQDWLLSEAADEYMVDELDGNIEICKSCLKSYEENTSTMNDYELKYLVPYLEKTKNEKFLSVMSNPMYAEILIKRAKSKAQIFLYEDSVIMGEVAWRIYNNMHLYEKAATVGLFLAETTDLMVDLEESKRWCKASLTVTKKNKNLAISLLPGDIWMRLAYVYFRQGKWEKSITGYKTAYECYAQYSNAQEKQCEMKKIESKMMLANALRNATKHDESIRLFEEIEDSLAYKALKGSEDIIYTNILMYHGWALHSAGRYRDAKEYLERAENMCDNVKLPFKDMAQIFYLRAVELFNMAEYSLAEDYCEKSLYYVKQAYGENAVEICSVLNQMGAIAQKQSNHEKAIDSFQKSYEIRVNYYGENNLFTSISLRNYAKALLRQGDQEKLKQVEYIFEKVKIIRENLAESGNGLGWLAQIYLDIGDYYRRIHNYSKAKKYTLKSLSLYKERGSERDISTCEMQIGMIQFEEGDYCSAKEAFDKAVLLCDKYYDVNHPYAKELREWQEKTNLILKI